jgi:hypothetical protein
MCTVNAVDKHDCLPKMRFSTGKQNAALVEHILYEFKAQSDHA